MPVGGLSILLEVLGISWSRRHRVIGRSPILPELFLSESISRKWALGLERQMLVANRKLTNRTNTTIDSVSSTDLFDNSNGTLVPPCG